MRFLSLICKLSDDDVDVIEADDEEGDDIVDTVDEVDDLCRSIGDGLSAACVSVAPCKLRGWLSWCAGGECACC